VWDVFNVEVPDTSHTRHKGTSKNWEVLFFGPLDFARDMLVEKIKFPLLLDSSAFGGLARRVKKEVFRGAHNIKPEIAIRVQIPSPL